MAASYQSKDSQVAAQQFKAQEVTLFANNTLLSVDAGDLVLQLNEPVGQIFSCVKNDGAGALTAIVCTTGGDGTSIVLTGEAAALATDSYIVKYSISEA